MPNLLIEVFEISGRGCVVSIDEPTFVGSVGDKLSIDGKVYEIAGIEMINYNAEGRKKMAEGWKPPLGLYLKGAVKSELLALVGCEVSIVADR